jgi:hypothetical protein
MQECEQTKGQSILSHGLSVYSHMHEIYEFLEGRPFAETRWRVPAWLQENRELLRTLVLPEETLRGYTIFHDCGKPFCREVDAEGRVHFPDHAEVSYQTWLRVFHGRYASDDDVAFLIRNDMKMHTMNSDECSKFLKETDPKLSVSLLLVALAEVHSNAGLFGGVESTSFKIKFKKLDQRGKQLCRHVVQER